MLIVFPVSVYRQTPAREIRYGDFGLAIGAARPIFRDKASAGSSPFCGQGLTNDEKICQYN
jgi:hypothetical protein